MKDLIQIFGIKWKRPLRWYEYPLLVWATFSALILGVDLDRTPIHLVLLGVANFIFTLWLCGKTLPDIEDDEEEEYNETQNKP